MHFPKHVVVLVYVELVQELFGFSVKFMPADGRGLLYALFSELSEFLKSFFHDFASFVVDGVEGDLSAVDVVVEDSGDFAFVG